MVAIRTHVVMVMVADAGYLGGSNFAQNVIPAMVCETVLLLYDYRCLMEGPVVVSLGSRDGLVVAGPRKQK